jgi:hypothetical protein
MTTSTELVIPADAVLLHFQIAEPAGLPLADLGANLNDLAELVAMAQVVATNGEWWPAAKEAAEELRVLKATYGSPLIVDSQVIEAGANLVYGLAAVGGMVTIYARNFKTIQEGRRASAEGRKFLAEGEKASAEAEAIRGNERREQIRFDRHEAELVLMESSKDMDPEAGWAVRRAVRGTNPSSLDGRKHVLRSNQFLRTLWRLAQKDSVVMEVEDKDQDRE